MTFDPTDHIKEADDIRTSGGEDILIERIKKLPDISDKQHGWRTRVFSGLTHRIFSEYEGLKEAYERNDEELATVAWHARNLMELVIWTTYCITDDDNARRFYEDARRDHADMLTRFNLWGKKTDQGSIWTESFENSVNKLNEAAAEYNVTDFSSKYLQIADVADQVEMGDNYRLLNKFHSKFAHPTAGYVVLPPSSNEDAKKLKTVFFVNGCISFVHGFSLLEQKLCSEK